jgi:hypothetical protein
MTTTERLFKKNHILQSLAFGVIPGKGTIMKLKGLKDLEIVLAPLLFEETIAHRYLSELSIDVQWLPVMQSLEELQLRRLRITIEAEFAGEDEGDGFVNFPTFSSRGETGEIEQWLRDLELKLHVGTMVAIGVKDWPSFAVKQDDDAIRIPPWNTDEALEKVRFEKERRNEQYRLEDEAFAAAQQRLISAGHPRAWTLEKLGELAETSRREAREQLGTSQDT